jgi:hypothetical protein
LQALALVAPGPFFVCDLLIAQGEAMIFVCAATAT